MNSKIDSIYIKHDGSRIYQGDLLRDFEYVEGASIETKEVSGEIKRIIRTGKRILPYLVILTQDCDLEQDFENHLDLSKNQDKFLHSILVCPAYLAEKFRRGEHLEELKLKMEIIGSERWSTLIKNQIPRYHFLESHPRLQIPKLVIDFKHYYTVPRDILYDGAKNRYIGSLNELFREALSQRFAYYLSRIGLPFCKNEETELQSASEATH